VNIALYFINEAYKNSYDAALILSRDSDLKPAIAMVRKEFPDKEVIAVAPPHLGHSADLLSVASAKKKITKKQVERSLFPAVLRDETGDVVATRPRNYAPPD
jgi:uncharacterized LabA/DUF88 family protein